MPEPAQVPSNNHNHPDNSVEGKTVHDDDNNNTGNLNRTFESKDFGNSAHDLVSNSINNEDASWRDSSNRNRNNQPCKPNDFSSSGDGVLVYDPGGNNFDIKARSRRDSDDDDSCDCNSILNNAPSVIINASALLTSNSDDRKRTSASASTNIASCAANNHHNHDRDYDKTTALPSDDDALFPIDLVRDSASGKPSVIK